MRFAVPLAALCCCLFLTSCFGGKKIALNSDVTLTVGDMPEGSLSPTQLLAIATDIRALERNPLAIGADSARMRLSDWAVRSPDVNKEICEPVIGVLMDMESTYQGVLVTQFFLSRTAYGIEYPSRATNIDSFNVGGLRGTLRTYDVLRKRIPEAVQDTMVDALYTKYMRGELAQVVRYSLEKCEEDGLASY